MKFVDDVIAALSLMCCPDDRLRTRSRRVTVCRMFGLFNKSSAASHKPPLADYCELKDCRGSAGPELIWKIYDARRLCDNKVREAAILAVMSSCVTWHVLAWSG